MDLSKYDPKEVSEKGCTMEVRHPVTLVPLPKVTITLAGEDSKRFRQMQQRLANKMLDGRGRVKLSAEQTWENSISMLARCTLSWTGIEWEGKSLPCNESNAAMVYRELDWLREQVDSFVNDRANFMGNFSEN